MHLFIQVLKLYAWEPSFESQVLTIRDKEVQVLKEQAYLNAGTSFIWSCAPFMVSGWEYFDIFILFQGRLLRWIQMEQRIYFYFD